jgi:hypothetical protein
VVTIVVPTRDRPEALRRCLAALVAQTCDELETVVVDDGSADEAAVARAAAEAGARLVRLDGRGAAAARNAGVAAARGEVVCFTDDDCEPEPEWAERLAARIGDVAAAAAGRSVAADPHDALAAAHESIAAHLRDEARTADGRRGSRPRTTSPAAAGWRWPCRSTRATSARAARTGLVRPPRRARPSARVRAGRGRPTWPLLTPARFLRKEAAYAAGSSRFRRTSGAPASTARVLRPPPPPRVRAGPRVGLLVLSAQVAAAVGVASDHVSGGLARLRVVPPHLRHV